MTPATADIVKEPELEAAEVARAQLMKVPSPSLMPVFRGQQMTEAFLAYRELQKALDAGMPDQLMNIRGKVFRKKGYWRAIATAFNLNVSCVKEEAVETGWLVVYRAATPSGRFIDGDGACEHDEKGEGHDSEHNVRSHAHTRAFNRAVSNLVGFGEVSAEEVRHVATAPSQSVAVAAGSLPSAGNGGDSQHSAVLAAPAVGAAPPSVRVPADVPAAAAGETRGTLPILPPGYYLIDSYELKDGGWHEFTILNFDAQGGALKLSTRFEGGFTAKEAWEQHIPVKVTTRPKPKGTKGEAYLQTIEKWSGREARL